MNCFSIALLLILCASALAGKPTLQELREALRTYHPIWVVLRSFHTYGTRGEISCVYYMQLSLTDYHYQYIHGLKDGNAWKHLYLTGDLEQKGDDAVVYVSETRGQRGIPHTLQYWNREQHCFILTFENKTDGTTNCQQHVWEPYLRSHRPGSTYPCEEHYHRICGHRKYDVYSAACTA
uniref:Lipocalin/cytosolic fatty-acid binding domain-containing protein n=1 Tax=Amblyomma maculatum TaxID=34609 RepID=G3MLK1_AMBMU